MIHFESITPDNWRLGLSVREDQREYVSDSKGILARAYAYRGMRSRALVIYNDDTPVGMTMYYDVDEDDCKAYNLSQFFIDQRYQGSGYGEAAMRLLLDQMKTEGKFNKVVLCYIDGVCARRMQRKTYKVEGHALWFLRQKAARIVNGPKKTCNQEQQHV